MIIVFIKLSSSISRTRSFFYILDTIYYIQSNNSNNKKTMSITIYVIQAFVTVNNHKNVILFSKLHGKTLNHKKYIKIKYIKKNIGHACLNYYKQIDLIYCTDFKMHSYLNYQYILGGN